MTDKFECTRAREAIQDRMDGMLEESRASLLDAHLRRCDGCRRYDKEMLLVGDSLESLPKLEMPDDALADVWSRTVDAGGGRSPWLGWKAVAAVAATLLIATLAFFAGRWSTPARTEMAQMQNPEDMVSEMTDEELQLAADEARLVLGLVSRELKRSQQAAVKEVLADQVSPALERILIDWPEEKIENKEEKRRQGV